MGESQFQMRLFIKVLLYLKIGQELKLLITINFQSVFKDHSDYQEDEVPLIIADSRLGLIQVDSDEVRDYLRSLDVNKAIGPDQLPTIVLKEYADSLAPSTTAIINHGLHNGLHLTQWKCTNIPPVYKKGKREEVVNFRPVSLLSVVSKVQERCVAKRLVPHVAAVLHKLSTWISGRKTVCNSVIGSLSLYW